MDEKKRSGAKTALKVVTGYHAVARTASSVTDSVGRLKSLFGLMDVKSKKAIRPKGMRYTVFSPYLFQYGEKNQIDGREIFVPEGVADSPSDIPEGKTVFKGAYFCGDHFGGLIDDVFTEAQQAEMIHGAEIKKLILVTGAVSSLAIILMFALTGRIFALASLPVTVLLFIYAVKFGIYAETLRAKKIMGLRDYFRRYGFFKGVFA